GAHDAPENMARDAALLQRCVDGAPEVVVRLFTFEPAGITLGRAQDPAHELDAARLAASGLRYAVRPTGGRAILHADEWTFSLVTPLGAEGWARTPAEAYERTGRLLAAVFRHLGVPAELAPGSPRGVGAPRRRDGAAPPCFASTARHELLLEGRKLAGIAQRAVRDALLQQGSLLLGPGHAGLSDHLALSDAEREAMRAAALAGSAEAGRWLGADRSLERLAQAWAACWPEARFVRAYGDFPPRS
ncbi:MAG: hypothetical protein K8R56_04695, partial [Candidatus Eisenbacteria bacterium]|nr:hypothetical protein [Candidatus Eisenbacteria bacterium]